MISGEHRLFEATIARDTVISRLRRAMAVSEEFRRSMERLRAAAMVGIPAMEAMARLAKAARAGRPAAEEMRRLRRNWRRYSS